MSVERSYRRGYTILELMISLVLLATLMMVAWSILGSYRDAEQRGWSQAYQMQVIRITRCLLETDAACLMEPRVPVSESSFNGSPSTQSRPFRGDAQGFEVDVIPSIDPLPWLEQVTRSQAPLSTTTETLARENPNPAVALDPLTLHRLRYKIVSTEGAAGAGAAGAGLADSAEQTFDLQRELIPIDRWSKASPASEKLLTTADLYRITDDELPPELDADTGSRTTTIRKLIAARFRYSDGKEWQSQWDSQLKSGLPRAIELSFDLPSASTDYEPAETEPDDADEFMAEDFANESLMSENLAIVDPPATATEGDDDALARDVRIVVLVPGSAVRSRSVDGASQPLILYQSYVYAAPPLAPTGHSDESPGQCPGNRKGDLNGSPNGAVLSDSFRFAPLGLAYWRCRWSPQSLPGATIELPRWGEERNETGISETAHRHQRLRGGV